MKSSALRSNNILTGNIARCLPSGSLRRTMQKNTLTDAQNRYWFGRGIRISCSDCNNKSEPCGRELSNEAFTAGARWAMRSSSELSPHIAKFIEMLILLGLCDAEDTVLPTERYTAGAPASGAEAGSQGEYGNFRLPALSEDISVLDADTWHDTRLL